MKIGVFTVQYNNRDALTFFGAYIGNSGKTKNEVKATQDTHEGQYLLNKPYRTGVRPYRVPTRDAPAMVRTRITGRVRTIVGASLVGALRVAVWIGGVDQRACVARWIGGVDL